MNQYTYYLWTDNNWQTKLDCVQSIARLQLISKPTTDYGSM